MDGTCNIKAICSSLGGILLANSWAGILAKLVSQLNRHYSTVSQQT